MTYGAYNPGARYRQRSQKRLVGIFFAVIFFVFVFGLGFWLGGLKVDQNAYIVQKEKKTLEEQYAAVQGEITQIRAESQTANIRLEQIKASYNEILSEGPMQEIVLQVKKQIDAGVDPQRIQNVILSARPPKNCSEPKSKRLLMVTKNYKGPESKILIESGLITILGEGVSAKDANGNFEAWYDPTKPVKLLFKPKNGTESQKQGSLPLYYSLAIENKEYRFTIAADEKSFAKVTYDSCDYP